MDFPYYPINDFGPLMKGMVIGGVAITHVFLAQFAIGGGLLLCYFQWTAMRTGNRLAREFVDGYFRWLVLISFVLGALTGVSLWFTTIQISPRTIGLMVDEFHWLWATEWTFFCTEVISGYLFYRYSSRLNDRTRLTLLVMYSISAWMSLFWINGILSWQLTPGAWLKERTVWNGFFNPTFWPSLVFRTISAMAEAGLFACAVINFVSAWTREEKTELLHRALLFLMPMIAMPALGAWFLGVVPPDSREWALGGSPAMTMFMMVGVGASLLIGIYAATAWLNRRSFISGSTAMLLLALAFAATAGGEFVREGIRKPYTVRGTLYANSIHEDDIKEMRRVGCTTRDPYPLADADDYPNAQLQMGVKTYRMLCSVCHTKDGANGLLPLTRTWDVDQRRLMIAKLQRTKPFMPPFAGTAEELESLIQWHLWEEAGRPQSWPESRDEVLLARIQGYLDEVGTESGIASTKSRP